MKDSVMGNGAVVNLVNQGDVLFDSLKCIKKKLECVKTPKEDKDISIILDHIFVVLRVSDVVTSRYTPQRSFSKSRAGLFRPDGEIPASAAWTPHMPVVPPKEKQVVGV